MTRNCEDCREFDNEILRDRIYGQCKILNRIVEKQDHCPNWMPREEAND